MIDELLRGLTAEKNGVLGIVLAGVIAYSLRMQAVFWRERDDHKARQQANFDAMMGVMRDRVNEQQALVKDLIGALDRMEQHTRQCSIELAKMQEMLTSKLEQMQLLRQTSGQK